MRWLWIDRIVELVPRERLVAIKNVSLAEEHLQDHFPARGGVPVADVEGSGGRLEEQGAGRPSPRPPRPAIPIMPASLIVEGMAQSAGILVGHAEGFREKVILAKVQNAELEREATPGMTLRYTATMKHFDRMGASTEGVVELLDFGRGVAWERIGRIDLMFSHIDQNMGGVEFPEENFVFGESFRMLLRMSGVSV